MTMPGDERAAGTLEFVARQPTDMETAEMMARLLDHHARIHDGAVQNAIERICVKLANPMYMVKS